MERVNLECEPLLSQGLAEETASMRRTFSAMLVESEGKVSLLESFLSDAAEQANDMMAAIKKCEEYGAQYG